jgi:hypothetical protein
MIHNFDFTRSTDCKFECNVCNRPDFFDYLAALGYADKKGKLTSGPIFDRLADGRFPLAEKSAARDIDCVRYVATPDGGSAALQTNGKLDCGAFQGDKPARVPDLEAQADKLLAEITGNQAG